LTTLVESMAAPSHKARPESPREMGLRLTVPRTWHLFLEPQEALEAVAEPAVAGSGVVVDLAFLPTEGPRVSVAPPPQGASLAPRRGLQLPWSEQVDVVAFRQLGSPGDVHLIVAGPAPNLLRHLERDFPEFEQLALPPPRPPRAQAVPWTVDGSRVVIGLPEGARLRITEILSIEPSRVRRWMLDNTAAPDDEGRLPLRGPSFARYN
ncbi:MAG: hypothetical protein VX498_00310, partial [Myxococcota bacterium]|nr:hypothetical protein [Myxococcota bacterium]